MYSIDFSHEAVEDLKQLRGFERAKILDDIERILTVNPTLESKAVLKKLLQPAPTGFRLRIGNHRVFYDVEDGVVFIVRILSKRQAIDYLRR